MITVRKLDTYKDGGTVGIFAFIHEPDGYCNQSTDQPSVTVDYAIGTDTPGQWYYGLRSKGAKLITDEAFKDRVRKAIKDHIFQEVQLSDKI